MSGTRTAWWPWFRALQALAPTDGAVATGITWSVHCWDLRSGLQEEDVLARVAARTLEDFRQLRRPEVSERTLRRHFVQLQKVGLLERWRGHSRHGPDVYVPRIPTAAVASLVDEDLVVEEGAEGLAAAANTRARGT